MVVCPAQFNYSQSINLSKQFLKKIIPGVLATLINIDMFELIGDKLIDISNAPISTS